MAISGIGFGGSLLNQSVLNIKTELANLQTQLATGEKSTTYSGMGGNEGFAIAARAQLANISAFTDTMTNVNTDIDASNTALQSISQMATQTQAATNSGVQTVNASGQTSAQQTATAQLSSILGILNTQAGDRYLFSGGAIDTPSVASYDSILNGNGAQAGLTQLISERNQADLGANGLGRLVITQPSPTSVSVAEDVAGSPFGLKLNAVTSTLTGATVTGPTGSPAAISVALGATNPNNGDQVSFTFNLPDGTTEQVQLTASSATPLATGSFAIGATPTATAANLSAALTTAIGTLAGTSLVAASALTASSEFFNPATTATGSAVNNKAAAPITGATLLSGGAGTDSLSTNFSAGPPADTITVNGTPITFVASGATGNELNVTDSVQTLLTKIDSITGTTTPSTISAGVITLNDGSASNLTVSSSNPAALAALGFNASVNATPAPLRVNGSPLDAATSLIAGTPANTVSWYTGDTGPGSARASATARVDQSLTVQYGIRANEPAITSLLTTIGAFAATKISPTNPNASALVSALNQRVTSNLTTQPGQQTIADIQSDLANAQVTMQDAGTRQTQAQATLQNMIDTTETVSPDQVASQVLALQTSLTASYQTTSMLSQLSLVKYLPVG
jgi:flagellar hook-associated protein 3 FlgL